MNRPSLLLVRFAAIGDCVMAAWAATTYRNQFPQGKLVWAIDRRCRAVVNENELVTAVAEFPRDQWKARRWSPATWREQLTAYADLRKHQFDWGVDLQGHSKTALALRIAKPKRRIQVDATDVLAARLNPLMPPCPSGTHTVVRNHTALCTFSDFAMPDLPVMPSNAPHEPKLVTISVGAGSAAKMWLPDRWAEVGRTLIERGWDVVLLGGPDDPRVRLPGARDLVAQIPLSETVSWVARSTLHLAADTGTGHMAAAYGVPVVSVFGPSDDAKFRPFTTNGRVLRSGTETEAITVANVLAAVDDLLRPSNGGVCAS